MLFFIIPLVHPFHTKVKNYNNILDCLKNTIYSLLSIGSEVKIIIIGYLEPEWLKKYKSKVIFIKVIGKIFDILRNLDDQTDKLIKYKDSNLYRKFLYMRGKFHNKDKGLKYFIGLLYLSKLKLNQQPEYIGLIDADDFIHRDIITILSNQPKRFNEFYIKRGYLLFSVGETSPSISNIYRTTNFTNICGSNRFYRYPFLRERLKNRLQLDISLEKHLVDILVHKKLCNNELLINIMKTINLRPKSWSILPSFFGIHRLYYPDGEITNSFHFSFKHKWLIQYLAVKLIHNNNHSDKTGKINEKILIERYKSKKFVPENPVVVNYQGLLKDFNINYLSS